MLENVAIKWVEALRSGEYGQTKNRLKSEGRFCCLGVLCDISKLSVWNNTDDREDREIYDGHADVLPDSVKQWAGMNTTKGELTLSELTSLAELNDKGATFSDIATIIEKHWREL